MKDKKNVNFFYSTYKTIYITAACKAYKLKNANVPNKDADEHKLHSTII